MHFEGVAKIYVFAINSPAIGTGKLVPREAREAVIRLLSNGMSARNMGKSHG